MPLCTAVYRCIPLYAAVWGCVPAASSPPRPFSAKVELGLAPERALVAALQANLVLVVRVLEVLHPPSDAGSVSRDLADLLADAVRGCATSLHSMLVAYDDLVWRRTCAGDGDAEFPF